MANYDNYVIQGNTLDVIAEGVKTLSDMDTSAKISPAEMTSKLAQANADVETQADLLAQIKTALDGKAAGSGSEIIAEIASLIDQSEVLDSTDGTVTEKVEQLIDKADDGNLWYEASKKITSFAANNQCPCFVKWAYSRLPRTDFSNVTSLSYAIYNTQLEYIDFYINSAKCTDFTDALSVNKKLKWIVGIDLSSATNIFDLFVGNRELETIQEPLNIPNVTNTSNAFGECRKLKDIRFVPESIKVSITIPSAVLTDESIQSIIDGLATVETAQTLTLNATVKAKLTDEQKATITNKNWNLA